MGLVRLGRAAPGSLRGDRDARLADGTALLAQVPSSAATQLAVGDGVVATIAPLPALAIAR
ncbi:hypothetical protein B4Q13_25670 [Lacticaseibacillus rhamnosus]